MSTFSAGAPTLSGEQFSAQEHRRRHEAMLQARLDGASWDEIAERFGMTASGVRKAVKREARKRTVRLPAAAEFATARAMVEIPLDWIASFVNAEQRLREAGGTPTRSARLIVPRSNDSGEALDKPRWRFVTRCLVERGWRVAVDDEGALAFYAPTETETSEEER